MRRTQAEYTSLRTAAWDLASKGLSGDDVAVNLNVPRSTVFRWLKDMSVERSQTGLAEAIQMELGRLERWQQVLELKLENPRVTTHEAVIATLLRLSERRAKLLGLDAAQKIEAQVHEVSAADIELAELTREAQAKAALEVQRIQEGAS